MIIWSLIYLLFALWIARGNRTIRSKPPTEALPLSPYTVLTAIRNETHNLSDFLKCFAEAEHTPDKVVLIDDQSEDGGFFEWLKTATRSDSFWDTKKGRNFLNRVHNEPATGKGKKQALRQGFVHCPNGIVLASDADARWTNAGIAGMLRRFEKKSIRMVCGTVRQSILHPHLLARLFEADYTAMMNVASGAAGSGFPFLCSGAALAVQKDEALQELPEQGPGDSGDDVFLLHAIVHRFGPQAIDWSTEETPVLEEGAPLQWLNQRLRWAGKSHHYRNHTAVGISLFLPAMHVAALTLLLMGNWEVVIIKLVGDSLIWGAFPSVYAIMLSLLYFVYLPVMPIVALFKRVTWKHRRVHQ